MMNISNRLKTIADFVHPNASLFDVGADHGLLDIYLLLNHRVKSVIAVENKTNPYNSLKDALKNYPDAKALYSDGLDDLPNDITTIVLAGLGGHTIVDILKKNAHKLDNVEQIVVDAHRDLMLVREEIIKLGYLIEKEKIVYENKIYYFVISFIKGHQEYDDNVLEFGLNVKEDELFEQFRKERLERLYSICGKVKNDKKILDKIRRLENL